MTRLRFGVLSLFCTALLAGCGDGDAPDVTGPTPIVAPSGTRLRIANLSADLNGVEIR